MSAGGSEPDAAAYARGMRFRFLSPDRPVPPWWRGVDHRLARVGLSLEIINTALPVHAYDTRHRLRQLLAVPRLSTFPIAALIQHAVRVMPPDQSYVNVGVWQGYSLLAGMAGNFDKQCVGVDDFSEEYAEGTWGDVRSAFLARFQSRRGALHEFHAIDYRSYFEAVHEGPIGVYVYDADHSYEHQLRALELAEPFMRSGSVVLIDDAHDGDVRRATFAFLAACEGGYEVVFDQAVATKAHPTWWGGVLMLRKR